MNWRLQVSAGGGILVIEIILYFVFAFGVYGSYKKAGSYGAPPWAAFIPIYNFIVLLKVAGRPITWAWFLLLVIIPFIGGLALFVISIIILHDVSKSFGHGGAFTVGSGHPAGERDLLVHPVAGPSQYRGPAALAGTFGGGGVRRRLWRPPAGGWLSPVADRLPGRPASTSGRAGSPAAGAGAATPDAQLSARGSRTAPTPGPDATTAVRAGRPPRGCPDQPEHSRSGPVGLRSPPSR